MSYDSQEQSRYGSKPVEFYRFTRGADAWRFTSADASQTLISEIYTAEVISRDEVDQSNEDQAGSITITVPRDNPVAALFIPYLPIEPVGVTIVRRHRDDSEVVSVFVGKVASASFEGSEARLLCMPFGEAMRRVVPGIVYQAPCNHALYGPGCTVDKESFKVAGAVTAVSGDTVQSAAFATKPDGWFSTGFLKMANGDVRFIIAHVGNTVTLMNSFPSLPVGSNVTAYAGCDRTEATCAAKFANLPNHMGWARIPTLNPFDQDLSGMGGNGGAGGIGGLTGAIRARFGTSSS